MMKIAVLLDLILLVLCASFVASLILYTPLLSNIISMMVPQFTHDYWLLNDSHLPNLVDRAVPFFVVSLATEFMVSKWREARKAKRGEPGNAGNNESPYTYFRANDTLNSLSMGMLQQMMHLSTWVKSVMIIPYLYIWDHYAIIRLDEHSWLAWIICLLIVEFGYYWYHRMAHEMNVFWAAHIAHHSSQEFNLSAALRQGAIQYSFSWLFFWPVALICPPSLVNFHLHFNRIYQFWIHTELIRRFPPPIEWLFNTPSHHRAHHGANAIYIDKNYGGTLIIFDRLFGTFQAELDTEPVVYGLTHNVNSWDPIWCNLHHWSYMWKLSKRLTGWRKIHALIRPPGWDPKTGDLNAQFPIPAVDPRKPRYNKQGSGRWLWIYLFVQYFIAVIGMRLISRFSLTGIHLYTVCIGLIWTTVSIGVINDEKPKAWTYEGIRIAMMITNGIAVIYHYDLLLIITCIISCICLIITSDLPQRFGCRITPTKKKTNTIPTAMATSGAAQPTTLSSSQAKTD